MTNAVHLSRTLARRLRQVSARSRRSPVVLARQAIVQRLDYLEGRLKAIDAGFADLEKRRGATTVEVLAELDPSYGLTYGTQSSRTQTPPADTAA